MANFINDLNTVERDDKVDIPALNNQLLQFKDYLENQTTLNSVDILNFAKNVFGSAAVAGTLLDNNLWQALKDDLPYSFPALQYVDANTLRMTTVNYPISIPINGKLRRYNGDMLITFDDLDEGVEQASQWYYVYVTADAVGTGFSKIISLTTGITNYFQVGRFYNDASKNIVQSSVKTFDQKYQDYEIPRMNLNSGQIPSMTWIDGNTVQIAANTFLVINRLKRVNTATLNVVMEGDLDTGAEAPSTTYYIWALAEADVPTFTCCYSTSNVAPTGKTNYLLIGEIYNDAASAFVQSSLRTYDGHYKYLRGTKNLQRFETGVALIANGTSAVTVNFVTAGGRPFNTVYTCLLTPQSCNFAAGTYPFIYGYADTANVYIYSRVDATGVGTNVQWFVIGD